MNKNCECCNDQATKLREVNGSHHPVCDACWTATMPAGPELDVAVAREVLKKDVVQAKDVWEELSKGVAPSYASAHQLLNIKPEDYVLRFPDKLWPLLPLPCYSQAILPAWDVLAVAAPRAGEKGWFVGADGPGWHVYEIDGHDINEIAGAETAPRAICVAALKRVRGQK